MPNFIVKFFTGGNTIVRVGLVILFFGLAFLVKYGVEHQLIPVELRVAAVAAAGIALLVVGWRLREKREGYALSLQGAGVAVLYLTVFGSLRLYHLLPPTMAFVMLAAIAALSAFLAIGQNSLALAVFGAAGGFMAPILASTGGGSHVMLFSSYLILNAAIFVTAWYRAWRVLNVVGFLFTFLIGLAWGYRSYNDELFETTEPFLIAFFLLYVAIAILFARKQVAAHKSYVDGMIVFGVPIATFGLQAGMLHDTEFGLAFTSVGMGALYLGLSAVLRRAGERWILLAESFLALGVVFVSLAIPLALDARWTSAAWALEAPRSCGSERSAGPSDGAGVRHAAAVPGGYRLLLRVAEPGTRAADREREIHRHGSPRDLGIHLASACSLANPGSAREGASPPCSSSGPRSGGCACGIDTRSSPSSTTSSR